MTFHVPSEEGELPHLQLHYPNGTRVPWAPSVTDTLLQDWEVVE